jgi:energy-coupling factor transport system ATP-binding protein
MSSAIRFENVSFSYDGKNLAIKDVSFEVDKGSKTVILGHNGSGKSTIAKLACGLLNFNNGKIFINDEKITVKNIDSLRSNVGIVFQNPDNQFVGASVRDDIAFGLENKAVDPSSMDEIISRYATLVNMGDYLDKEPANLSGGQKQRVAIASVLAMESDIIFLDEATSMLDPIGKKDVNNLISDIQTDNPDLTIISITHDVEEVLDADHIIVISNGSIVFDGDLRGFFEFDLSNTTLEYPFMVTLLRKLKEAGYDMGLCDEKELIDKLWLLSLKK